MGTNRIGHMGDLGTKSLVQVPTARLSDCRIFALHNPLQCFSYALPKKVNGPSGHKSRSVTENPMLLSAAQGYTLPVLEKHPRCLGLTDAWLCLGEPK